MGELGDGSGSSYPSGLDTDNSNETTSTVARSDVPNDLASAIVAVETELGTDPAGSTTNVKTFLQFEHETDGTHGAITPTSLTPDEIILNGSAWPSFHVNMDGNNQVADYSSAVKAIWRNEEFDTNSDFEIDADGSGGATESRFTPTVAGKYMLYSAIVFSTALADAETINIKIYKNGSPHRNAQTRASGAQTQSVDISCIVDANGSTDYFEVYVVLSASTTETIDGTSVDTYFGGSRIA